MFLSVGIIFLRHLPPPPNLQSNDCLSRGSFIKMLPSSPPPRRGSPTMYGNRKCVQQTHDANGASHVHVENILIPTQQERPSRRRRRRSSSRSSRMGPTTAGIYYTRHKYYVHTPTSIVSCGTYLLGGQGEIALDGVRLSISQDHRSIYLRLWSVGNCGSLWRRL